MRLVVDMLVTHVHNCSSMLTHHMCYLVPESGHTSHMLMSSLYTHVHVKKHAKFSQKNEFLPTGELCHQHVYLPPWPAAPLWSPRQTIITCAFLVARAGLGSQ